MYKFSLSGCQHLNDGKSRDIKMAAPINYVRGLCIYNENVLLLAEKNKIPLCNKAAYLCIRNYDEQALPHQNYLFD